ncbi:MAG: putative methyltransferase-domain-containing protein [Benjaminiella poitrasii]|nr:MAG: putative methyltransferase-domain-containing protein [Benjaminiella poitrasii]
MSTSHQDDRDFEIGNLPEGLNVTESTGAPSHLHTQSLELKQDIGQFGLAGKIWQSAYILQALFSFNHAIKTEPCNPIPISYYNENADSVPTAPYRILELGAGTGYVGIALAQQLRKSAQVYITDLEQVVPLINENVQKHYHQQEDENGAEIIVDRLHWGNHEDAHRLLDKAGGRFDLIIVSDCVYFPELFSVLLDTLLDVCGNETQVVIGYKTRSLEKELGFWQDYFGRYFEYEPVRQIETIREEVDNEDGTKRVIEKEETGDCLGAEDQSFVFIGKRRPKNEVKKADDTFTTLLFCFMGI